jgi:hypothetical protein
MLISWGYWEIYRREEMKVLSKYMFLLLLEFILEYAVLVYITHMMELETRLKFADWEIYLTNDPVTQVSVCWSYYTSD